MANLEELARKVKNEGYSEVNAEARVCQDIVLKAIAQSSLNRNVTIKGGKTESYEVGLPTEEAGVVLPCGCSAIKIFN